MHPNYSAAVSAADFLTKLFSSWWSQRLSSSDCSCCWRSLSARRRCSSSSCRAFSKLCWWWCPSKRAARSFSSSLASRDWDSHQIRQRNNQHQGAVICFKWYSEYVADVFIKFIDGLDIFFFDSWTKESKIFRQKFTLKVSQKEVKHLLCSLCKFNNKSARHWNNIWK